MTEPMDMSTAGESKRLVSNQQRLQGKETRVIFEFVGDTVMRVYVCIVKENNTAAIKR